MTSLGHAGLRISGGQTHGLVNPWFDPAGAFLGSWHPLPDNRHLVTPSLLGADWIAVASERDDHLDLTTLARVPAGTPVFVPASRERRLARRIETSTHLRAVELRPWEQAPLDADNSWLAFLPASTTAPAVSPLLLSIDGVSLLAAAPLPPSAAQVHRARRVVGGHLDVLAVQAAHPSPDPMCERASPLTVERRSFDRRAAALEAAAALVRVARPVLAIPYGGPPCFLDPAVTHHNRWLAPPGILPDLDQVATWLRHAVPGPSVTTLLPGDRCFPADGLVVDDDRWSDFSFDDLGPHLRRQAYEHAEAISRVNAHFPPPDHALGAAFAEHVVQLVGRHPELARTVRDHVRFEVTGAGGGVWDVLVDRTSTTIDLDGRRAAAPATIRIASRWIAAVVEGRATWNQLLLSLRYSIEHARGRFQDPVLDLLGRAAALDLAVDDGVSTSRSPSRE
jgi:UDP-MurNAc hydroxylase